MTIGSGEIDIPLGIAGFVVNILVLGIGGVWKLSRVEGSIRDLISDHRMENDGKINTAKREFGETIASIRQKVVEVELYTRDHFVQKEAFSQALSMIEADIKGIGERIEARLLRIESKTDNVLNGSSSRRRMVDKD